MASQRIKYLCMCVCLLTLLVSTVVFAARPALTGRVLLATPRGTLVLRDVRVLLLVAGTNTMKAQTYTDSNGTYAFFQPNNGSYEIELMLGNSILRQKVGVQWKTKTSVQLFPTIMKVVNVIVAK